MAVNPIKTFLILLFLSLIFSFSSCADFFTHKEFKNDRPEICDGVFDGSNSIYTNKNRLQGYSVEDLLTLQKCGLEYSPQISLVSNIVDQPDYPTSAILERLQNSESENFQYYLLMILVDMTESNQHKDQLKKDKTQVLEVASQTVSKMKDEDIEKSSRSKLELLKIFFSKDK